MKYNAVGACLFKEISRSKGFLKDPFLTFLSLDLEIYNSIVPNAVQLRKMLKGVQYLQTERAFSLVVSGCLLDSSAPRGPPDVPPRNPAMSRLNGRLPGSHAASDHERDPDLEPSCLVRTPSGNFYNIPSEFAGRDR